MTFETHIRAVQLSFSLMFSALWVDKVILIVFIFHMIVLFKGVYICMDVFTEDSFQFVSSFISRMYGTRILRPQNVYLHTHHCS